MRYLLFFMLFFASISVLATNNQYFIKNYDPAESNDSLSSDVYCIGQCQGGTLVFGTKSGIYLFDGINTLYYQVSDGNYIISCLPVNENKIFLGLSNGFGYLVKSNSGKYEYYPLSSPENPEKTYKILKYLNNIVFCTKQGLYFFDEKGNLIKELKPVGGFSSESYFHNAFVVNNVLYVRQAGKGLLKLDKNLEEIKNGSYFSDIGIFNIRNYKGLLEILSVDNGIYLYNKGEIQHVPISCLSNAKVRGALSLDDGNLCIFTNNNGVFVLDSLYHEYAHFSSQNGLMSDKISSAINDIYGNIWTAGENGIHYIAYNSSIMLFNRSFNLPGKIHCVANKDNILFVASSLGLYTCPTNNLSAFVQNVQIKSNVWDIKVFGNQLIIASDNGVYTSKNGTIKKISQSPCRFIQAALKNEMFCCIGKKNLLLYNSSFRLVDSLNLEDWHIETITGSAMTVDHDTTNLYISHYSTASNNGNILKYKVTENKLEFISAISAPSRIGEVHLINGSVYFSTPETNYIVNHDKLERCSGIFGKYAPLQAYYKDSEMELAVLGDKIGYIKPENTFDYSSFNYILFQKLFNIERFNGNIYFSTDKGLYTLFSNRKINQAQAPRFTISLIAGKSFFDFNDSAANIDLLYNQNSFNIIFNSTYFYNNIPARFKWRIKENNEPWNDNNNQNSCSFFNVASGHYTFEIKAVAVNGIESPVKSIYITIEAPWYRKPLAYVVYFILIVAIVIAIVRLYSWRLRRLNAILENKVHLRTVELINKNKEIESQKAQIEKAHHEITDSIHYARRIQSAVLPSNEFIKKIIDNFFIFYRPRDVVSGDFYWINKVDNTYIFITADCTGHGVPGAFMSLLGISLLNEIILENRILSPDIIINNLRERLIKLLNPENENAELVRDGMDISVCTLNKETKEIHFAGANNKMLIVRTSSNEIVELDADPMPAGYYEVMKPFSLQSINYTEGDIAVLFSDGYKDQFGGPDGKKFLIKRLKELLINVCKENSSPEKSLENAFLDWKGNFEQVDDVMVLGFYVNGLKE